MAVPEDYLSIDAMKIVFWGYLGQPNKNIKVKKKIYDNQIFLLTKNFRISLNFKD